MQYGFAHPQLISKEEAICMKIFCAGVEVFFTWKAFTAQAFVLNVPIRNADETTIVAATLTMLFAIALSLSIGHAWDCIYESPIANE